MRRTHRAPQNINLKQEFDHKKDNYEWIREHFRFELIVLESKNVILFIYIVNRAGWMKPSGLQRHSHDTQIVPNGGQRPVWWIARNVCSDHELLVAPGAHVCVCVWGRVHMREGVGSHGWNILSFLTEIRGEGGRGGAPSNRLVT